MKKFLLFPVFFFCPLISFSQVQHAFKSGINPGNEIKVESSSLVLYDSLVNYEFTAENDSVLNSKTIYHYNDIPKISEKFSYRWDNTNNRWKNDRKSEYAYDGEGRTILDSYYDWNATENKWHGISKYVNAYDPAGNRILVESYQGYNTNTDSWVGSTRYEDVFDNTGHLLSRTNYFWNYIFDNGLPTSMWSLASKEENQYNVNGTIDSAITYTWNNDDSAFYKTEQKAYTYDQSDSLALLTDINFDVDGNAYNNYRQEFTYDAASVVCITYHWDYNANEWIFYYKTEKVRNALGKETLLTNYLYDIPTESWIVSAKNEYTYDENGNQTSYSAYLFVNADNSWIGVYSFEFKYDDHNRQIKKIEKEWDSEINDWKETNVYESSFNLNGDMATYSYYSYMSDYGNKIENIYNEDGIMVSYNEYSGTPEDWKFYGRGYYYWTPGVISGTEYPRQPDQITVYPNPVVSKMQIDGLTGKSMLYIYNSHGLLVLSREIENKEEIDLGRLPAGLYLTRINSSAGVYKGKFVKGL
jgi:hypothetical protein